MQSFKQISALLKVSDFWLILTILQRQSTNLSKSCSCSVHLVKAYCYTRPCLFMGRRWYLSLQSEPWTVPGASFMKQLQNRWLKNNMQN